MCLRLQRDGIGDQSSTGFQGIISGDQNIAVAGNAAADKNHIGFWQRIIKGTRERPGDDLKRRHAERIGIGAYAFKADRVLLEGEEEKSVYYLDSEGRYWDEISNKLLNSDEVASA